MAQGELEKRFTPLIILVLAAALVAVLGLWAADKAGREGNSGREGGAVATSNEVFEWLGRAFDHLPTKGECRSKWQSTRGPKRMA